MAIVDSPDNFQIGRVVSRTFSVLSHNAAVILMISALLMLPMLLLSFYVAKIPAMTNAAAGKIAVANLAQIYETGALSFLVLTICTYILQASVIQGTLTYLNGEPVRLGDSLSAGFRSFLPIVVIALLSLLGMTAGMILLIIPGIILALAWSVVIPVRVVENTGISESFGRSRALTKDHRWKILALFLLYFLAAVAIELAIAPFLGMSILRPAARAATLPVLVVTWIERVVFSALTAVGIASIYYELRLVKEGAGASQLAAAFD